MDVLVVLGVLGILLLMISAGVPVAFALLASGAVGFWLLRDLDFVLNTFQTLPFSTSASYTLTLVPMYLLLGTAVVRGGVATQLFRAAVKSKALRRFPAGLGIATIGACGAFAAVSGSSVATAATMGRVTLKEMTDSGYSRPFAAGIVASGGTLGVLIPPSLVLVLYGIVAGESIGDLLIAGIIPGIITVLAYVAVITFLARRHIEMPVAMEVDGSSLAPVSRSGLIALAKVAVIFLIVVGGIYGGVFTATESGAVGALAATLMLAWALRADTRHFFGELGDALAETAKLTSMIFLLLIGGTIFARFLVLGGVSSSVGGLIERSNLGALMVVAMIGGLVLLLGMFLDAFTIIIIVVPVVQPILIANGIDGIWFGILLVKLIELGLVTPPVGLNAYIVAGVEESITVEDVFRGVVPFYAADLVIVLLLVMFPILATGLPAWAAN